MEISAYNEDGTTYQEPVYDITYEEVRNEYKPVEMGPEIISFLSPTEELVTTNITYSSASATSLNFSSYVKNYNNIRYIIFTSATGSFSIFDYQNYLNNVEAGVNYPLRMETFDKDSGGYLMGSRKSPTSTSQNYYYFKEAEWNANGDMRLCHYNGSTATTLSYARYGRIVKLVYKKED